MLLELSAKIPGTGTGTGEGAHEGGQTTSSSEMGTQQVKFKVHGAALQSELDMCVHTCGGQRPSSGTVHFVLETGSLTGLEPTS